MSQLKTLAITIGLSDFSPGRALYLSRLLKKLGYKSIILTNKNLYVKNAVTYGTTLISITLNWINYHKMIGRMLFYLFFSFLCFIKMLKILSSEKSERVLIITRHPYPLSTLAALAAKRIASGQNRKIIVIADVTDLWPESLTFMSENLFSKTLQLIGTCLNRVIYKRCDYITVHNHYYKEYVWKVYLGGQIKKSRIFVIPHFVDTKEFVPLTKKEAVNHLRNCLGDYLIHQILTKVVIGYSGLISSTIGSDILFKIFKLFENDNRFIFLITGEGPLKQKLINFVKQNNMRNVLFIGPFPHELMRYAINLFDIAIITSYHKKIIPPSRYWFPKKLAEYATCGKPIVFVGISDFVRTTLKKYSSGISLYPEELKNFRKVLETILSDYQFFHRNSRRMAEKEFSLETAREKLKTIIGLLSPEKPVLTV